MDPQQSILIKIIIVKTNDLVDIRDISNGKSFQGDKLCDVSFSNLLFEDTKTWSKILK